MATAPQTTPDNRNGIREGWSLLRIPGGGTNRLDIPFDQMISHHGHQREQPEKYRRGPSDREVTPLSLSFYPEMRSGFFKGHLHAPTSHEPGQDLQWRMVGVRRKKRLGVVFALWVADQHPMNQNRLVSGFVPRRLRIAQALLWGRTASAFDSWPPVLSRFAFWGRVPQLRIHSQSCNQAGLGRAADTTKQIQHGKTVISHEDQLSIGQPASDQLNDLPGPLGQVLMPSFALGLVAFRWTQDGQERQPPDRFGPRELDQQHAAEPTQAAGFGKMRTGRPHRVAVDAFGFDLGAAPPLDRVINPKNEFAIRRECGDQQSQQDLARRQSSPSRPIQDSMIVLKMDLLALAHNAQASRDRAFAGSQDRSNQQDFGVFPNGLGEQRGKLYNQGQHLDRQCLHGRPLLAK